ncbi:hypothetical protein SI65_05402 [Aspergillus cristatus]|uniref:Zn(2)-C6 fungal-type domain-containing protein n=1 Tax=Aspergillus cristatus TaxID=573508 RepID=A0A1E3BCU2_ASPCR|nr:hypothetical protein SI65_05402 [Aspergillus cristatus]
MLPQRRQNSSCDPCRRSKRRCFFASPRTGDMSVACTHCKRLGHACTFDFVNSISTQKKQIRQTRARTTSSSESAAEASLGLGSADFQVGPVADNDVLASWFDLDYLQGNNEGLDLADLPALDAATSVEASETRLSLRPSLPYLAGSSLNSPIRLLNSKLDASILDMRLARIHDTIVTGYASCMMTVLGTVRFLDHFSGLYGNRLTTAARRQSDAVLKAVLRAFSLQWLSTSEATSSTPDNLFADSHDGSQTAYDTLANAFHDAWYQARLLLRNAQSTRSFRVVYATLLFDGIAIPTKAHGLTEPIVAHEFLDAGLQKLCSLDALVKQYCVTLGSYSVYGALLESSLSVVRWGGYIRDIGAALTTDHRCKLPGVSSHLKAASSSYGSSLIWFDSQNLHPDLDDSVPSICQKAVADAFCVWRQIVEVKAAVSHQAQTGTSDLSELLEPVSSTLMALGKFNQMFHPFMNICIENLDRLSIHSRTSCVSIVLFWNFSVLILAESLEATMRDTSYEPHLTSSMRAYQQKAVFSVARTVERVLSLPTDDLFNLENGLAAELPLLS